MMSTILQKQGTVLCLIVLLLCSASSTTQAQDNTQDPDSLYNSIYDSIYNSSTTQAQGGVTQEQASQPSQVRHSIGTTISLLIFWDDLYPVPAFSYELQYPLNDRVGVGFRASTLFVFQHVVVQGDVFLDDGSNDKVRVALGLGAGLSYLVPAVSAFSFSLLPRLLFQGKSSFSLGVGYNFLFGGFLDEDDDLGFVTVLLLWRVGGKK